MLPLSGLIGRLLNHVQNRIQEGQSSRQRDFQQTTAHEALPGPDDNEIVVTEERNLVFEFPPLGTRALEHRTSPAKSPTPGPPLSEVDWNSGIFLNMEQRTESTSPARSETALVMNDEDEDTDNSFVIALSSSPDDGDDPLDEESKTRSLIDIIKSSIATTDCAVPKPPGISQEPTEPEPILPDPLLPDPHADSDETEPILPEYTLPNPPGNSAEPKPMLSDNLLLDPSEDTEEPNLPDYPQPEENLSFIEAHQKPLQRELSPAISELPGELPIVPGLPQSDTPMLGAAEMPCIFRSKEEVAYEVLGADVEPAPPFGHLEVLERKTVLTHTSEVLYPIPKVETGLADPQRSGEEAVTEMEKTEGRLGERQMDLITSETGNGQLTTGEPNLCEGAFKKRGGVAKKRTFRRKPTLAEEETREAEPRPDPSDRHSADSGIVQTTVPEVFKKRGGVAKKRTYRRKPTLAEDETMDAEPRPGPSRQSRRGSADSDNSRITSELAPVILSKASDEYWRIRDNAKGDPLGYSNIEPAYYEAPSSWSEVVAKIKYQDTKFPNRQSIQKRFRCKLCHQTVKLSMSAAKMHLRRHPKVSSHPKPNQFYTIVLYNLSTQAADPLDSNDQSSKEGSLSESGESSDAFVAEAAVEAPSTMTTEAAEPPEGTESEDVDEASQSEQSSVNRQIDQIMRNLPNLNWLPKVVLDASWRESLKSEDFSDKESETDNDYAAESVTGDCAEVTVDGAEHASGAENHPSSVGKDAGKSADLPAETPVSEEKPISAEKDGEMCGVCGYKVPDLAKHSRFAHRTIYRCGVCKTASFYLSKSMKSHLRGKHNVTVSWRKTCTVESSEHLPMRRKVHKGPLYECTLPLCHKRLPSMKSFVKHLHKHHAIKMDNPSLFCVKVTPEMPILAVSAPVKIKPKPQSTHMGLCPVCLRTYPDLSSHNKDVHTWGYKCRFCNKSYFYRPDVALKHALKKHSQMATRAEEVCLTQSTKSVGLKTMNGKEKCIECDKYFRNIKKHTAEHTSSECNLCGQYFMLAADLKPHLQKHSITATSKAQVREHFKDVEKKTVPPPVPNNAENSATASKTHEIIKLVKNNAGEPFNHLKDVEKKTVPSPVPNNAENSATASKTHEIIKLVKNNAGEPFNHLKDVEKKTVPSPVPNNAENSATASKTHEIIKLVENNAGEPAAPCLLKSMKQEQNSAAHSTTTTVAAVLKLADKSSGKTATSAIAKPRDVTEEEEIPGKPDGLPEGSSTSNHALAPSSPSPDETLREAAESLTESESESSQPQEDFEPDSFSNHSPAPPSPSAMEEDPDDVPEKLTITPIRHDDTCGHPGDNLEEEPQNAEKRKRSGNETDIPPPNKVARLAELMQSIQQLCSTVGVNKMRVGTHSPVPAEVPPPEPADQDNSSASQELIPEVPSPVPFENDAEPSNDVYSASSVESSDEESSTENDTLDQSYSQDDGGDTDTETEPEGAVAETRKAPEDPNTKYKCETCSLVCANRKEAEEHLLAKHHLRSDFFFWWFSRCEAEVAETSCNICGRTGGDMDAHKERRHGIMYECNLCKAMLRYFHRRLHFKRKHGLTDIDFSDFVTEVKDGPVAGRPMTLPQVMTQFSLQGRSVVMTEGSMEYRIGGSDRSEGGNVNLNLMVNPQVIIVKQEAEEPMSSSVTMPLAIKREPSWSSTEGITDIPDPYIPPKQEVSAVEDEKEEEETVEMGVDEEEPVCDDSHRVASKETTPTSFSACLTEIMIGAGSYKAYVTDGVCNLCHKPLQWSTVGHHLDSVHQLIRQCTLCRKSFIRSGDVKKHLMLRHRRMINPGVIEWVRNPNAQESVPRKRGKKRLAQAKMVPTKKARSVVTTWQCSICDESFDSNDLISRHLSDTHNVKEEKHNKFISVETKTITEDVQKVVVQSPMAARKTRLLKTNLRRKIGKKSEIRDQERKKTRDHKSPSNLPIFKCSAPGCGYSCHGKPSIVRHARFTHRFRGSNFQLSRMYRVVDGSRLPQANSPIKDRKSRSDAEISTVDRRKRKKNLPLRLRPGFSYKEIGSEEEEEREKGAENLAECESNAVSREDWVDECTVCDRLVANLQAHSQFAHTKACQCRCGSVFYKKDHFNYHLRKSGGHSRKCSKNVKLIDTSKIVLPPELELSQCKKCNGFYSNLPTHLFYCKETLEKGHSEGSNYCTVCTRLVPDLKFHQQFAHTKGYRCVLCSEFLYRLRGLIYHARVHNISDWKKCMLAEDTSNTVLPLSKEPRRCDDCKRFVQTNKGHQCRAAKETALRDASASKLKKSGESADKNQFKLKKIAGKMEKKAKKVLEKCVVCQRMVGNLEAHKKYAHETAYQCTPCGKVLYAPFHDNRIHIYTHGVKNWQDHIVQINTEHRILPLEKEPKQCPLCKGYFPGLKLHLNFCRKKTESIESGGPSTSSTKAQHCEPENAEDIILASEKELEQCTHCNGYFTRLKTHLKFCKKRPDSSESDVEVLELSENEAENTEGMNPPSKKQLEQCTQCNGYFARVKTHLKFCGKKLNATPSEVSEEPAPSASPAASQYCKVCLRDVGNLREHSELVHKQGFHCSACNRIFYMEESMRKHAKEHGWDDWKDHHFYPVDTRNTPVSSTSEPKMCKLCGKCVIGNGHYRWCLGKQSEHERDEVVEVPHAVPEKKSAGTTCNQCGLSFKRISLHVCKSSGAAESAQEAVVKQEQFWLEQCLVCERYVKNLVCHQEFAHTNAYKCLICSESFFAKKSAIMHAVEAHKLEGKVWKTCFEVVDTSNSSTGMALTRIVQAESEGLGKHCDTCECYVNQFHYHRTKYHKIGWICTICEILTYSVRERVTHLKIAHDIREADDTVRDSHFSQIDTEDIAVWWSSKDPEPRPSTPKSPSKGKVLRNPRSCTTSPLRSSTPQPSTSKITSSPAKSPKSKLASPAKTPDPTLVSKEVLASIAPSADFTYFCKICNYDADDKPSHIRFAHALGYKCKICAEGRTFSDSRRAVNHYNRTHKKRKVKDGGWVNNKLIRKYLMADWEQHFERVDLASVPIPARLCPQKCQLCSNYVVGLNQHYRESHSMALFCNICNKNVTNGQKHMDEIHQINAPLLRYCKPVPL